LDDDTTAALAAERTLARAHHTRDLSCIDALLHTNYRILQPSGAVETKTEVMAAYAEEDRRWDLATVTDLEVQCCGEVAQVVGLWRAVGSNRGQAFDYRARFLSVWLKEDEEWRNIAYSSVELPPE